MKTNRQNTIHGAGNGFHGPSLNVFLLLFSLSFRVSATQDTMLRNPSSSSSSTSCLSSSSTSYYSSSVDSITCHFCSGRIPSVISFKYLTKKDFIRPRSFSPLRGKDSETLNQEQSSSTTDQSEQNYGKPIYPSHHSNEFFFMYDFSWFFCTIF